MAAAAVAAAGLLPGCCRAARQSSWEGTSPSSLELHEVPAAVAATWPAGSGREERAAPRQLVDTPDLVFAPYVHKVRAHRVFLWRAPTP